MFQKPKNQKTTKIPAGDEVTNDKGEGLFVGLQRGLNPNEPGTIANTCFYSPLDIRTKPEFLYRPSKFFLGLIDAEISEETDKSDGRLSYAATKGKPIGLADDRHILTVAGSRSGKGVSAIVPNLLSYKGSILAIDPKGELASMTAKYRKEELGQDVLVLDPFKRVTNTAEDHIATYNPLDIITLESKTAVEDAGLIADALIIPTGNDSHWDDSARNILEGLILHVSSHTSFSPEERNLRTVYDLTMRLLKEEEIQVEMEYNRAHSDSIKEAADAFFEKDEKERNGVLSTLRRQIRFLGYQSMGEVLETSSFDLDQLKTKPTTIYLCLPAMRLGTCSRWFRLFINIVLARMEETVVKPDPPVLLCLDEFASLGYMKTIEDAAGQIAGFGCRLWPILQDLGQLETLYNERWQTFMANAGILQFFGNSDMKTLEWLSGRLGETRTRQFSDSNIRLKEKGTSDSTGLTSTIQNHALMTPEEISRFFARDDPAQRQLVIVPGKEPIILQRVCYYKDHRFKDFAEKMPSEKSED